MVIETTKRETIDKPETFDGYYEYTIEGSNKFWAYSWDGNDSINIYWGKIDSKQCQTQKKMFGYHFDAAEWLRDKVNEKIGKGYA